VRSDASLRESEARLRAVFDQAAAGLARTDLMGRFVEVNDRYCAIVGRSREELLALSMQDITHPSDLAGNVPLFMAAAAGGPAFHLEKRYVRPDGSIFWVRNSVAAVVEDGCVGSILAVTVDISGRKHAEAALRELNETLESRVIEEVEARLGAEDALRQAQKMEAVGQLTGGIAHDFNNLLTVIRSSADLLHRCELPEEKRRRYVDAISDTADGAAKLTSQLLAFARRQALKPEVFDIIERVRGISDMLRIVAGSRIVFTVDDGCDRCFVEADPSQFETAIVNLAVNARDAMDG
jgi:PAS domain S-box-containing protein